MTVRRSAMSSASRVLLALFLFGSAGCREESPSSPTTTPSDTITAPLAPPTVGRLRVAQLTLDARTVTVAIDGEQVAAGLGFPSVSAYLELSSGPHRVQFFPARDPSTALVETNVSVVGGGSMTVAVVGNDPVSIVTIQDDTTPPSEHAQVRLFNAVRDFPAPFDLGIVNGPKVVENVFYLDASSYRPLIPGFYDFVLQRAGSEESIAVIDGALTPLTNSTVFAVGTLGRGDITMIVVRDET